MAPIRSLLVRSLTLSAFVATGSSMACAGIFGIHDPPPIGVTDASAQDGPPSSGDLGALWLAYGASGQVAVRGWDEGARAWSAAMAGPNVDGRPVHWVVPVQSSTLGAFVAVMTGDGSDARLDVYDRNADGSWKPGFGAPMVQAARRAFDVEVETTTGNVLVVYGDAAAVPKFRRRTAASGWSAELDTPGNSTRPPQWVDLVANPLSDEIALVYTDGGANLDALIWSGATQKWGLPHQLDADIAQPDFKSFDAAYEAKSGRLVVAWGHEATSGADSRWVVRDIGAAAPFSAATTLRPGVAAGPLVLASEPEGTRIALSYMPAAPGVVAATWAGTGWTDALLDSATPPLYQNRPGSMPSGVAWLGGVAIAAFSGDPDAGGGRFPFARFSGDAWGGVEAATTTTLPARASFRLLRAGAAVVALVEDVNGSLWCKRYDGGQGAWSDADEGKPLATGLIASGGVPFGVTGR
jgi:hypothetical protein